MLSPKFQQSFGIVISHHHYLTAPRSMIYLLVFTSITNAHSSRFNSPLRSIILLNIGNVNPCHLNTHRHLAQRIDLTSMPLNYPHIKSIIPFFEDILSYLHRNHIFLWSLTVEKFVLFNLHSFILHYQSYIQFPHFTIKYSLSSPLHSCKCTHHNINNS